VHSANQEHSAVSAGAQRIRIASDASYLTRLGLVYAHPIRLKIVTELYMREMSATQFFQEFSGPSKNLVHWHFKQLATHGWLRKVRSERKRSGRGRPRDVYRATELAVIGDDTWHELPLSIRSAFSCRTLEQLRERVMAAFAAQTFDLHTDRHLTWTPAFFKKDALAEQLKAMTSCFWAVLEEQADAKVRLQMSGEEPILMTVALAGFESPKLGPGGGGNAAGPQPLPQAHAFEAPWLMRLAKVFVDPLNMKIVTALNLEAMSPSQLAARFDSPSVFAVDRRCKLLTQLGWIVKVGEKTGGERRGATENFYRATGPAVLDGDDWSGLSAVARESASVNTFRQFWEKVGEALEAETFDARNDRHLTWSSLLVDRQGWNQVIKLLDDYFDGLLAASRAANAVRGASDRVMGTFFLAGFESPQAPSAEQLAVF
jgi:predicted transcriptional regulator